MPDDATQNWPAESRPEIGNAFTPRQILGGFVLLAALIVLLRRRRTRDKPADDEPADDEPAGD